MTQIAPLTIDTADAATAATLKAVKAKLGMVPNLFATLALSLIHISEPTRRHHVSRMPSSA